MKNIFENLFVSNACGKASEHRVLQINLENLGFQGRAGITYGNRFYLKCFWKGFKTPSFAQKLGNKLSGVGMYNMSEWFLFEIPSGTHENTKLCREHCRAWVFSAGPEQYIFEKFLFEMPLERHKAPQHRVLHTKLQNLGFQGWARIVCIYIIYIILINYIYLL